MVTRAVPARSLLTPLAVLVPILGTVLGAFWALTVWPPLALLAIAAGFAFTAVAGRRTYGVRRSLVAAALTVVAGAVALMLWALFGPFTSICGKSLDTAWLWLPYTGGALVYFVLGSFGFRTFRASSVVPMAFLFGVLMMFLLVAAVPGTPGFCET
jgi:hypothetical protein